MSEDFVSRDEFNNLKNDVQELKEEVTEYRSLLQQIDKKIDVKRLQKLEDNQGWLWKLCASIIITGIIGAIITFN